MAFKGTLGCLFFSVLMSQFTKGMGGAEKKKPLQVYQQKQPISVRTGDDLRLECRVTGDGPPGPVRWFLGEGPTRKVIYAGIGRFERVTRNSEKSNEDFTIVIHNVTWEDAGIYYCVKLQPGSEPGREVILLHGGGTEVAVTDSPPPNTIPVVAGVSFLLLAVLFLVAVYIYVKKRRGRNQDTSRPEVPTRENTRLPNQVVNKEIVYADLKDPSGLRRTKQRKTEEHSEYATVRVA